MRSIYRDPQRSIDDTVLFIEEPAERLQMDVLSRAQPFFSSSSIGRFGTLRPLFLSPEDKASPAKGYGLKGPEGWVCSI